jgi:hypothetical protein
VQSLVGYTLGVLSNGVVDKKPGETSLAAVRVAVDIGPLTINENNEGVADPVAGLLVPTLP